MPVTRQCPTGNGSSLVSFPIALEGITPTVDLYNSIKNPLNFDITWGSSAVLPEFSLASVNFAEVYHPSFNTTSLSYLGNNYVLQSIQFTQPTHKSWLALVNTMASPLNNKEDVILTFMTDDQPGGQSNKAPQFIILVSPIIRIGSAIRSSAFLNSLANQVATPIGPDSLFPNVAGNQFAYYTTCSIGLNTDTDFNNSLVVVNVQGLLVWDYIMITILKLYNKTPTTAAFPVYVPPAYGLFEVAATPITTLVDFKNLVSVTIQYTSTAAPRLPPVQQVATDSYKCVPLNPDTDVSGGAIKVDASTGDVLSNTLSDRQATINAYNTTGVSSIPYNVFEQYTRIFLIVMISVIGVWLVIYSVLSLTVGPESTGGGASRIKMAFTGLLKVPIYVVVAFFCTFIGIMVGIFVKPT